MGSIQFFCIIHALLKLVSWVIAHRLHTPSDRWARNGRPTSRRVLTFTMWYQHPHGSCADITRRRLTHYKFDDLTTERSWRRMVAQIREARNFLTQTLGKSYELAKIGRSHDHRLVRDLNGPNIFKFTRPGPMTFWPGPTRARCLPSHTFTRTRPTTNFLLLQPELSPIYLQSTMIILFLLTHKGQ
jgi:hypothetical protein